MSNSEYYTPLVQILGLNLACSNYIHETPVLITLNEVLGIKNRKRKQRIAFNTGSIESILILKIEKPSIRRQQNTFLK